ncbi:hypothetical protein [Gordonia bronchialis]|uniref:hypothetical protein n=1 Tax=Gordonia bronchialis TaxID=2054 RepID=UPI002270E8F0|nr:hypothetical protein [Gordonia bronchialis]
MDKRRLEGHVVGLVERIVAGGGIEDDYVECKRDLPPTDHRKAARQIAGLCNAARSDNALWIIGLDEGSHRVVTPEVAELADWWPQVERCFDGVAPDLSTLGVPTPYGPVTVLQFVTDRSPYVVTTDGKGGIDREVPWRVGNQTRTATRSQLLSLLVANTAVPELELINPELSSRTIESIDHSESKDATNLTFEAGLFVSGTDHVMLPSHRWSVTISSDEWESEGWGPLHPELRVHRSGRDDEIGVQVVDASGIYVNGAGRVALRAELSANDSANIWSPDHRSTLKYQAQLRVIVDMPVDGQNRSARAETTLHHRPGKLLTRWIER